MGGPGPARQAIVHTGPLEMVEAVWCVYVELNQGGALAWASLCIVLCHVTSDHHHPAGQSKLS